MIEKNRKRVQLITTHGNPIIDREDAGKIESIAKIHSNRGRAKKIGGWDTKRKGRTNY